MKMNWREIFPGSSNRGFTLIEIVIVVAIMSILVMIGIPNFLRVRMNANDNTIRSDLRTFSTSNESFRSVNVPPVYAQDIPELINRNYLDSTWLNPGNKHGYIFTYERDGSGLTYSLEAAPLIAGVTGVNFYCVDQTGVILVGAAAGMGAATGCSGGMPVAG